MHCTLLFIFPFVVGILLVYVKCSSFGRQVQELTTLIHFTTKEGMASCITAGFSIEDVLLHFFRSNRLAVEV